MTLQPAKTTMKRETETMTLQPAKTKMKRETETMPLHIIASTNFHPFEVDLKTTLVRRGS